MRTSSSPLSPLRPPLRTIGAGLARANRLFTKVVPLSLLLFVSIVANTIHAQPPLADSAYSDRALGADAPAFHALQEGRVEDAATLLRTTLTTNPSDTTAHQLLCRVFYSQDQADNAIRQCELAVSSPTTADTLMSDNELWLGRAYGMKARHAGPLAGFSLARKVQSSFSRAVELNPSNLAALNDLGEYEVAAPFIVGGGSEKAEALAATMMPRYPAAAHRLLARLADSNNDFATAEAEFKRAVAIEGSAEAWMDLAQFYQTRSRPDDALVAIKSGLAADHSRGPVLVDAASILIAARRAPDLAEHCLRDYLASHAKSDAAPAFKVHLQLSRLLAARGDSKDAGREVEVAAELAPAFKPNARPAQGL